MGSSFYIIEKNPDAIPLAGIPVLSYQQFTRETDRLMASGSTHCLNYFVVPSRDQYRFICLIADDSNGSICILSHVTPAGKRIELESLTSMHSGLHIFEREIHEEYGIEFHGHPWLKPVRFPSYRADRNQVMDNYDFYQIGGEEHHEVGVGPIHAGVIEPGHFRFICNGERVLHLEIQLGYQHRGVERLLDGETAPLQKILLSENIAGDTATGHALCHVQMMESLSGRLVSQQLQKERAIAIEMERIAVHIGDTAALCGDIAYQIGQAVNEALRTLVINTTQQWCGNRFGKGLMRPGGTNHLLTSDLKNLLLNHLSEIEERYLQMSGRLFSMPSVLSRFESTGRVTKRQAELLGTVGMAARSSGVKRDIRWSHPFQAFRGMKYNPVLFDEGDVWARAKLREAEVVSSVGLIRELLMELPADRKDQKPDYGLVLSPSSLSVSAVEGWRGEIVHTAVTDENGKIIRYKVKDPSLHNWMALAIAMRNQEISDFPLCNKSFNLSYCGHDL
ncbi:MAG: NADH-quinone oxidoreductase subunit C [bacterium]